MRVIAGEFRSRVLAAPHGMATRPTSDRLRETLFNVLAPRIAGARFLDLYAGSGAVGIEALSRGAAEVVFVERAAAAVKVLRENLEKLGIRERARVQTAGAATYLRSSTMKFDVVFLDPPYEAGEEYAGTLGLLGGLRPNPMSQKRDIHPKDEDLSHHPIEQRPLAGDPESVGIPNLGHPSLAGGAVVVAEHRRKDRLEARYGALMRTRLLEQGDAGLSFYSVSAKM